MNAAVVMDTSEPAVTLVRVTTSNSLAISTLSESPSSDYLTTF